MTARGPRDRLPLSHEREWKGEAPAEPLLLATMRLGRSLALPRSRDNRAVL